MVRTRVWIGFAALCLLLGTEWVADLAAPRVLPGLWGGGVRVGMMAGVFALAGMKGRGRWGGWRLAGWGAGLLSALPLAMAGAGGSVTELTELLAAAFVPVVVVFAVAQVEEGVFRLMVPALAAFGGAALLVSYTIPNSARGLAGLGALTLAVMVTGVAVVRVHELLGGTALLRGAAVVCGGGALGLLACCWVGGVSAPTVGARATLLALGRLGLVDVPVMLLSVWLLRAMRPVAYAARYVLGLFVAVAESFAVARPGWNWTMVMAVGLVGGGVLDAGAGRVVGGWPGEVEWGQLVVKEEKDWAVGA